jgi:hypothetical protein
MLIPGFFLILLVCWLLDHLFIEEMDDNERHKARGAVAGRGVTGALAPAGGAVANASAPKTVSATRPAAAAKKKPTRQTDGVIQIPRVAGAAPAARPATGDGVAKPKTAAVRTSAPAAPPVSGNGTAQPAARTASAPAVRAESNGSAKPVAKPQVAPRSDPAKVSRPAGNAPALMPRKEQP